MNGHVIRALKKLYVGQRLKVGAQAVLFALAAWQ